MQFDFCGAICHFSQMFLQRVSYNLCIKTCGVPDSRQDIKAKVESGAPIPAYLSRKVSNVLVAVAGQRGLLLHAIAPSFPSSADMQYRLSKYLDNWI